MDVQDLRRAISSCANGMHNRWHQDVSRRGRWIDDVSTFDTTNQICSGENVSDEIKGSPSRLYVAIMR